MARARGLAHASTAYATYVAFRTASALAQTVPEPLGDAAANAVAAVLGRALRSRRQAVRCHLRRITGFNGAPLEGTALSAAVDRAFMSYARYWLDSFRLPRRSRQEVQAGMAAEGLEYLRAARAAGRGAILVIPHLGGWDFGGAWMALTGFPITVVVEPLEPPRLFEWFASLRRAMGMTVVPLGPHVASTLVAALRAGEVVGLLADRDLAGTGIEVSFFGERTTLPGGPATLALRTGAALMSAAVYFDGVSHYGVIRPPIDTSRRGALRDDVARITQDVASELEALISKAPEQWHVLQPNWPSERHGHGGSPSG